MKTYMKRILFITGVILALSVGAVYGQSAGGYDLSWWTIDGGGGQISAGGYVLAGSIGQPDASAPLTAGGYELTGGYWSGGAAANYPLYLPLQAK